MSWFKFYLKPLADTLLLFMLKDQGEIDDRPLAASAFKAWLGSPERSRLEDKVEDAYQKHVVRRDGPQAKPRPKSEREAPKVSVCA